MHCASVKREYIFLCPYYIETCTPAQMQTAQKCFSFPLYMQYIYSHVPICEKCYIYIYIKFLHLPHISNAFDNKATTCCYFFLYQMRLPCTTYISRKVIILPTYALHSSQLTKLLGLVPFTTVFFRSYSPFLHFPSISLVSALRMGM